MDLIKLGKVREDTELTGELELTLLVSRSE